MMYLICPTSKPRPEERWTNVHVPEPNQPDEPDDTADVFESVSQVESERLEFFNLNLIGTEIMTNSIATAMQAAGITHAMPAIKGHSYFDPIDVVEDNLGLNSMMMAKVTSSLAWNLDIACINAARAVLYSRYAESDKSTLPPGNPFDLFCQGVVEDLSHQSLYDDESPTQTLAQLLALRAHWHDAAQSATAADNRDYNPKSLEQMLIEEKPLAADVGERTNLKIIARMESGGDTAKETRLLQSYIDASNIAAANRTENNKKLIPTITLVISTVQRYAPAETRFDHLPKLTQKILTERTVSTVNRIKMEVAKTLARNPIEFGHVIEAAYKCTNQLIEVLGTKFSDHDELEYAGMPHGVTQYDRNQKRIASNKH